LKNRVSKKGDMGKLSFFYDSSSVYKVTLKALARRDFVIDKVDEATGIIQASSRKKLLKPIVKIELAIEQISDKQTSMSIKSSINKSWITPEGYESRAEEKFINTLYKCFETM
jgi:hypothetical protein